MDMVVCPTPYRAPTVLWLSGYAVQVDASRLYRRQMVHLLVPACEAAICPNCYDAYALSGTIVHWMDSSQLFWGELACPVFSACQAKVRPKNALSRTILRTVVADLRLDRRKSTLVLVSAIHPYCA